MQQIRSKFSSPATATVIGLTAPIAWGMNVPIMRSVVEGVGVAPGECLVYLMAGIIALFLLGIPDIRLSDKRYLVAAIASAVGYTICLVLAVYFPMIGF